MPPPLLPRREFMRFVAFSGVALSGCAGLASRSSHAAPSRFAPPPQLHAIRASADRIVAMDVCTRPFRAQGPRIEVEEIGTRTVVHNYGHGGSGWSLSWGSAAEALRLVQATGTRTLAVVGCGAIGLTTALVAQRAGLQVRVYARERLPNVPSAFATGVWSPASRIATVQAATPAFEQRWRAMAQTSFRTYQTLLGLPGEPVGWHDFYHLRGGPPAPGVGGMSREPEYAEYHDGLGPKSQPMAPGTHPFRVGGVRRGSQMVFNLATYPRLLLDDFLRLGGTLETREFASPGEFASLPEPVVVNATGYGARALFGDESLVPVRGQTARLIPQPEVTYGLSWAGHNLFVVPRGDGILVQAQQAGDYGNADITPDPAQSRSAVERLALLFA